MFIKLTFITTISGDETRAVKISEIKEVCPSGSESEVFVRGQWRAVRESFDDIFGVIDSQAVAKEYERLNSKNIRSSKKKNSHPHSQPKTFGMRS